MEHARPETALEAANLVRQAVASGRAVYPRGGNTLHDFGMNAIRPGIALDLSHLRQVVDYPARDMTITVQAGITFAALTETLAAEGQCLPIDVPFPDRTTLGGAVAANLYGPRRLGHGTLRDYVIGIEFINDRAVVCKAGGRVVKNVAGYDLCKLLIGSWGTLGVVTQLTLKVKPLPEACACVRLNVPQERLARAFDHLHASSTRPVAAVVRQTGPTADGEIFVFHEESHAAVTWQCEQLSAELRDFGEGKLEVARPHAHQRVLIPPFDTKSPWLWQASLPPSRLANFLSMARPGALELIADAGRGTVWGEANDGWSRDGLASLRYAAESWGGSLMILKAPPEARTVEILWGPPRSNWKMMQAVKAALDPDSLFNPGRFLVSSM